MLLFFFSTRFDVDLPKFRYPFGLGLWIFMYELVRNEFPEFLALDVSRFVFLFCLAFCFLNKGLYRLLFETLDEYSIPRVIYQSNWSLVVTILFGGDDAGEVRA